MKEQLTVASAHSADTAAVPAWHRRAERDVRRRAGSRPSRLAALAALVTGARRDHRWLVALGLGHVAAPAGADAKQTTVNITLTPQGLRAQAGQGDHGSDSSST